MISESRVIGMGTQAGSVEPTRKTFKLPTG